MKGTAKIFVIAVALVILVIGVAMVRDISSTTSASAAKPQGCPKGQESQSGCKYVRHMNTGECGWLPDQAVASPWEVVPEGSCDKPKSEMKVDTVFSPKIAPTLTSYPAPGEPKDPVATKDMFLASTVPAPCSGVCDPCVQLERIADSLETVAAAQATQVAP